MRIAVYHNLEKGGALLQANKIIKSLSTKHYIKIFSTKKNITIKDVKTEVYKINSPKNIFEHVTQAIYELKRIDKEISKKISNENFDLVIVFPCIIRQSPHILRYTNKNIYFFAEPKREFYENTNFSFSLKKLLTLIIRYPIKISDKISCKAAKTIICNSYYSKNVLRKIYKKKGFVIYPGQVNLKPKKIYSQNNKKIISIGQISKIKGHDYSIKQLEGSKTALNIIGREVEDSPKLYHLAQLKNVNLNVLKIEDNKEKIKRLRDHSIFLANNKREPFGITTLEAIDQNLMVLGKNEAGTSEVVRNGIDGFLYPNKINMARTVLENFLKRKHFTKISCTSISWDNEAEKLLSIYHHLKNDKY